MEKRLLTAVFLSLIVLYVWAGIFNRQPHKNSPISSQRIGVEEVVENNNLKIELDHPTLTKESQETTSILENSHVKATFSNIGGLLKSITIKDYNEELPVTNLGGLEKFNSNLFRLDKIDNNSIKYSYDYGGFVVNYEYKLENNGYTIKSSIFLSNYRNWQTNMELEVNSFTIDPSRMDIKNARERSLFEYAVNSYEGVFRKNNAYKFSHENNKRVESHVIWTAFRNRYFCLINVPETDSKGFEIRSNADGSLSTLIIPHADQNLKDGVIFSSIFFAGPERYDLLSSYNLGLEKVKRFYKFGLFDLIAMAIYRLMHLIYRVIPNWGVSIVLISLIIYFSMYPLTLRGMSSMKKMQALQPEIAKIKEKYTDNPQKMNQEMMRIYKENKINPMGGCLPFLLQMPVFIGLYQVLWRSVTFKGAHFLWIKDLSEPDRLIVLSKNFPFIGNEINLLPILMMIIMAFQQKLTAMNMNVSDPAQRQQQKMMGVIMPIFLCTIFYKFASGLTLYFTLFYLFSTFTQYYMYKKKGS